MHYSKMKKALSSLLIASMLAGETLPVFAQDAAEADIAEAAAEEEAVQNDGASAVPAGLTEGVDYVAGRLLAWTDSEDQALELAEAYEGELISWEYGVTLIAVDGTVEEALQRSVPEGLPKAEPDYIIRPADAEFVYSGEAAASGNEAGPSVSGNEGEPDKPADDTLPERRGWEYWYDGSETADPYLNPTDGSFQYFHSTVDSFAAWGVTTGKDDIKVVLVGSGVDADHEDLAGAKLTVNDVGEVGKDDKNGNGTHAAGLIAGQLRNGKGGAGIAPGVKLLSISVMDDEGHITESRISAAIGSLVLKGQDGSSVGRNADIIDFSDITGVIPSETEAKAIKAAVDAGITVIAGVGDEGSDALTYPAAYEGVIRVGAAEKNGTPAVFSNKCSDMIYAPGVDIVSTRKGGGYESRSSSNSAAAIVTGMTALYMSAKGYVKPEEMKKALKNSVKGGCVNMAQLFDGSTEAPNIAIYDGEKNLQFESPGKSKTPDIIFTGDSRLRLENRSFSHDSAQSRIIYTTNGKAPKIENGKVTEGQIYTEEIELATLCEGEKEQEITIQAATITGLGVISDPSTLTIKILPGAKTELAALEIVDYPEMIVPDKDGFCSVQLKAQISGTITSPVLWKCESADGVIPDLNKETGLLTINKGNANGDIYIFCYAERPKYVRSEAVHIRVNKDAFSVDSMSLAQKSLSLNYSSLWDEDRLETECGKVSVERVTSKGVDGRSIDLLNNGQYLYLRWSSSNEKVLKVEPSEDRKSATVIPVGAGTAKVICTAMDGSDVSASVKVTVKQYVEDFAISGPLYVQAGKSYTYKVRNVMPGKAEQQGVTWMIRESGEIDWASVNPQSGVLTVKKKAEVGDSFTLVATTMDGSEINREVTITVVKKLSKSVIVSNVTPEAPYYAMKKNKKTGCITSLNLYTKKLSTEGDPGFVILSAAGFNGEDEMEGEAEWSCSDPKVVKIEEDSAGVKLKALKPGSVTITCTMNDGSGKKAKIKVKVMNPVEKLELSGQTAVARGASASFKAASYLPSTAVMKKVEWSLAGTYTGVTVSAAGKVKVTAAAPLGTVTLLAKAKDGCGTSAQISFLVVEKKTKSF
ncbi:MAG: S8 family serine peptidase, partial [Lachnospiraceae bacterium]|nr:S8 family serine peptidase [Lachnospiraceae bacterium]